MLLLLLLAGALPEAATGQRWRAELRAGELRYEGGPGLESSTALAGLRYGSSTSSLLLSAGLPLSGEDPLWAAVAGVRRLTTDVGPLAVGVDLSGDLFAQHDRTSRPDDGLPGTGDLIPRRRPLSGEPLDGWGASGGARLVAAVGEPSLGLEVRAGGVAYRSEFAGERFDRDLWEGDVTARWAPSDRLLVTTTGRRASASEADYVRVGASLAVDHGRGMLFASTGRWLGDGIRGTEWSAGGTLDLSDRVALRVATRRTLFDPLYLTPERTSWGVGLTVALDRPDRPAPPVPERYVDGRATVLLEDEAVPGDSEGGGVRIAGDFTAWKPVAMRRTEDGWRYRRALGPGVYNYAFVTEDGRWFVPEGHPGRRPDGFGGHVAVMVIEEAP